MRLAPFVFLTLGSGNVSRLYTTTSSGNKKQKLKRLTIFASGFMIAFAQSRLAAD
ncbi:hypothetical protein [Paenibacillus sp. SAF-054]|uniref:hypothetical protein n=1 Tax=Paenibacillus sp. SAF-054 TaxID=3436863 RepID=UPI003F8164FC